MTQKLLSPQVKSRIICFAAQDHKLKYVIVILASAVAEINFFCEMGRKPKGRKGEV